MSMEPAVQAGPNISRGASGALVGDAIAAGITGRRSVAFWLTILLHETALALTITTEVSAFGCAIYRLDRAERFVACNGAMAAVAALTSLEIFVVLILLSRFKFDKLWATLDFIDVMIVDHDTTAFYWPPLRHCAGGFCWPRRPPWLPASSRGDWIGIALDLSQVSWRSALPGPALIVLCLLYPTGLNEDFESKSYISKFTRTGVRGCP